MELAVPLKTENFLGTWGREIPGQGGSDSTEEDLEQLAPLAGTPGISVQFHKPTPSKASALLSRVMILPRMAQTGGSKGVEGRQAREEGTGSRESRN